VTAIAAGADPRAKVFLAAALSLGLVLASPSRAWIGLPAAALLAGSALDARGLRAWIRAVLVLWGITIVCNAVLVGGERYGPESLGGFRPSVRGVGIGLVQGARLAGLAGLSAWLLAVTAPLDLAASLEWGVRGREGVRRRVHDLLLPVVLALRVLPLFVDEGERLLAVDRLRGGSRGGLRGVVRAARLAPAWMTAVVERGEQLALAMTLRGYRPGAPRGFAREYRLGPGDAFLTGVGLLGFAFLGIL